MTVTVLEFKDRVDAIKRRVEKIDRRRAELQAQANVNTEESNKLYYEREALIKAAQTFQKYLGGKE